MDLNAEPFIIIVNKNKHIYLPSCHLEIGWKIYLLFYETDRLTGLYSIVYSYTGIGMHAMTYFFWLYISS